MLSSKIFLLSLLLCLLVTSPVSAEDTESQGDVCCYEMSEEEVNCTINDSFEQFTREVHATGMEALRDILISIFLVLFGGMMSGLTIGLLSLDPVNLEIMKSSGDPTSRKYANGISPLVERHHLLLVTLLMANAVAMESLPLFLDRVVSPLIAIIISVTAVLIFGEIIPQAICTANGLAVGYYLRFFVYFVMLLLFVIAYPLSLILDMVFGKHHATYYRRAELKELVAIHGDDDVDEKWIGKGDLNRDEITIIKGALDMSKKTVEVAMTPIDNAFMLPLDAVFDRKTLKEVEKAGNSRIPIYHKERQHVVGMVLVKKLIMVRPRDATPVLSPAVSLHRLPYVPMELPLYDMLNIFQTGKAHMAMVLDPDDHITLRGIITLEDVIEELIQEEIVDETDVFVDVVKQIKVVSSRKADLTWGQPRHGSKRRKSEATPTSSPGTSPSQTSPSMSINSSPNDTEYTPLLDDKGSINP